MRYASVFQRSRNLETPVGLQLAPWACAIEPSSLVNAPSAWRSRSRLCTRISAGEASAEPGEHSKLA